MERTETHQTWAAQIDASGRLLIPAPARHAMHLDNGTNVVIESDGVSLRILTLDQFTHEVQNAFGRWQPGEPLWSEELIEARRAEAERERRA